MRLILLEKIAKYIASMSIRYEIISDSYIYTLPYSFSITFMCVLIVYRIHHDRRVDGKAIRYESTSDSFESDIV